MTDHDKNDPWGLSKYTSNTTAEDETSDEADEAADEVEDEQEPEDQVDDKEDEADGSEQEESSDEAESDEEVAEADEESQEDQELLKKRLKDTRDFATKANQKAVERTRFLATTIKNLRSKDFTDEDIAQIVGVKSEEVEKFVSGADAEVSLAPDPLAAKIAQFDKRYNEVKNLLPEMLGEDPMTYVNAMNAALKYDQELVEEFLRSEDPVAFVFGSRGKEVKQEFSDISEGSIVKAYKAQKQRIAELEKRLAAKGEPASSGDTDTPQKRRKLPPGKPAPAKTENSSSGKFKLHDWE